MTAVQEIRVPEDHPTLAEACEAAGPAACIVLGRGTFTANALKLRKSIELRGEGEDTVLDLQQTRLIVRGKNVGLVVGSLTATNGVFWVYEGGAITLTDCTLHGAAVLVSSTHYWLKVG